jgi:MarR family 2-MHQ and catechol resistance regulon transcriptional repressor
MARSAEDCSGVHLWLILMKAHAALLAHAQQSFQEVELGDSDFFVLEALLHKGPLPVNTIGQKVRLTSGSISIAVDRLVRRKLAERQASLSDKRVRLVQLTEDGRRLIEAAFAMHSAAMETAASGLSETERSHLVRLLKKLGKTAAAAASTARPSGKLR